MNKKSNKKSSSLRMNTQRINTLKKVLKLLSPYKFSLILTMLLSALTVALTLYVPILIGRTIDLIIGKGRVDFLNLSPILIRIAVVVVITALIQWILTTINNRITYHVVRDMRDMAFEKIEKLPLSYLDVHPSGDIASRIIADLDTFSDGLLMGFTQLFTGVVTILGTLVFMLTIRVSITVLVVILTPISFLVAKFIATHSYKYFKSQSEIRGEQTALINEVIENQKVVKAFTQEDEEIEKFDEVNGRLTVASLKATFFSSLTNPTTRFVNSIVYASVALSGAFLCVSTNNSANLFTVGNLSALLVYANQYTKPFNDISGVITELQNALACAARIFELLDEKEQVPDDSEAEVLNEAKGNISLQNVCFSYVLDKKLIEDFNLDVKSGQRVAIVGPTGCGKTTVINLLMRFYDVNSGKISVDGINIRDITRKSLRSNYGMVLQETWLKSGTIRENIVMGKPDASDEEVMAAAKASHAHSFIKRLENGYDTLITEDGGNLSQGQKQLLCITRIMLCLPPMLILDEATSSIDTRTEIKIQNAFTKMMKGRTTFIVAHRLSTIREADIIIVMKDGHIIETGNHDELLKLNGFYANLYNSQFSDVE